jgi:two-component system response regulator HydG
MRDYNWPGNVRELLNVVINAVLAKNEMIFSWDLPDAIRHATKVQHYQEKVLKSLKETEKERIITVLNETRGNVEEAARILGISRATLYNKLKEYDISKDQHKSR